MRSLGPRVLVAARRALEQRVKRLDTLYEIQRNISELDDLDAYDMESLTSPILAAARSPGAVARIARLR